MKIADNIYRDGIVEKGGGVAPPPALHYFAGTIFLIRLKNSWNRPLACIAGIWANASLAEKTAANSNITIWC